MTVYPTTTEALTKVQDYKLNFFNPVAPRNTWWHTYSFNQDFNLTATWGKDSYFFAYAQWKPSRCWIADVDDLGWITPAQVKPYKGWIFWFNSITQQWEVFYDADSSLWTEDQFIAHRKTIKAML